MPVMKQSAFIWCSFVLVVLAPVSADVTAVQNLEYLSHAAQQAKELVARFAAMNPANFSNPLLEGFLNMTQLSSLTDAVSKAETTLAERLAALPEEDRVTVNPTCLNHLVSLLSGLVNTEDWALRMLDATGKPPSGVLSGNLQWLGSYDECVAAQAVVYGDPVNKTHPKSYPYTGRYCTAALKSTDPSSSLAKYAVPIIIGICVPNSCSAEDMSSLIHTGLYVLPVTAASSAEMKLKVTCQLDSIPLDTKALAAIVVCSVFAFVITMATLYDVLVIQRCMTEKSNVNDAKAGNDNIVTIAGDHVKQSKADPKPAKSDREITATGSRPDDSIKNRDISHDVARCNAKSQTQLERLLQAFSIYTNGAKILNTSQPAGTLSAVNGIRFLSMSWVLLGHVFGDAVNAADNPAPFTSKMLNRFTFQAIVNATFSVDSFFVLSGMLVAYLTLKEMEKVKGALRFSWLRFYFHRFWRLTPPYMLLMLVYLGLTVHVLHGPQWPHNIEDCDKTWWKNLLYIQNFFDDGERCMGWTWYLAVDMQLYVISPLLLVPLFYSKIAGSVVCLLFILASMVSTGVIAARHNYSANLLISRDTDYVKLVYYRPYTRMGPYMVGIFTGFLLYRTKCQLRIPRVVNLAGWASATAIALAVLYGLYDPDGNNMKDNWSGTVNALYHATSRTAWGVALAWVIFSCATGHGGFVNTILSWKAFIPLARLSYMAYMCHLIVINVFQFSRQATVHLDDLEVAYLLLGHLCVTYAASFVLSLAFEAPMMSLEKVLLGRGRRTN